MFAVLVVSLLLGGFMQCLSCWQMRLQPDRENDDQIVLSRTLEELATFITLWDPPSLLLSRPTIVFAYSLHVIAVYNSVEQARIFISSVR